MEKLPDLPELKKKSTKTISLRVETSLADAFEALRRETSKDIPECQRIALRDLAARLSRETKARR